MSMCISTAQARTKGRRVRHFPYKIPLKMALVIARATLSSLWACQIALTEARREFWHCSCNPLGTLGLIALAVARCSCGYKEILRKDLDKDVSYRACPQILYRELLERSCTEILPRGLLQRSCQKSSYRELVQRSLQESCQETSFRDLVRGSCQAARTPLMETLYKDIA